MAEALAQILLTNQLRQALLQIRKLLLYQASILGLAMAAAMESDHIARYNRAP
jgi:hypothetical protein